MIQPWPEASEKAKNAIALVAVAYNHKSTEALTAEGLREVFAKLALAEKNCEFLRKHSDGQSNDLRWEHERLLNELDKNRVWQQQLAEEKAKTARMQREIDALKTQVKGDIGCASTTRCEKAVEAHG
jgi:hypothetical protein